MDFPYNNINIYPPEPGYAGSIGFQPQDANNAVIHRQATARGMQVVADPTAHHNNHPPPPPITESPHHLPTPPSAWESPFPSSNNSVVDLGVLNPGTIGVDHWIDSHQHQLTGMHQIPEPRWNRSSSSPSIGSPSTPSLVDDMAICGSAIPQIPATLDQQIGKDSYHQIIPNKRSDAAKLQCKWQGCTYTKQFSRTADVLRHVRVVHLARGEYVCPVGVECKPFNRKDNLTAHMQRRHNVSAMTMWEVAG